VSTNSTIIPRALVFDSSKLAPPQTARAGILGREQLAQKQVVGFHASARAAEMF
jgi:hypothetical protein